MDLPLCTVAGFLKTSAGPIIGIFHNYAYIEEGDTVHSVNQMRAHGIYVDDCPSKLGGKQYIATAEGFTIPLIICKGLAHMELCPPTDAEMTMYPHVTFTSEQLLNPQDHDYVYKIFEFKALMRVQGYPEMPRSTDMILARRIRNAVLVAQRLVIFDDDSDDGMEPCVETSDV